MPTEQMIDIVLGLVMVIAVVMMILELEANDLHIEKDGEDVNKYCHLADIVDLIDNRLAKVELYVSEQNGKTPTDIKKAVIKKKVGVLKGSKLVNGHFVMPTVK